MMKKITLLILMLIVFDFGFGQTKLAEITFETPGGYSTSIVEFTDQGVSTGLDYFIRTDGSNTNGQTFSNLQGSYYFAAHDIDGEGASLPVSLLIDNVNISGYSSLNFRIYLAEDDATDGNQDWDNTGGVQDYIHINYDIDNTLSFSPLIWVEPNGGGSNNEPSIDTDYNGTGDGTAITDNFEQFIISIPGTGSLLDIEIEFSLNAGDEDIAIDNIEVWGTLIPCATTVTWDGATSTWSNAGVGPDINTSATLNGNYDTSVFGSFSACSLNVNSGTLRIGNNTYVEVQNDLVATGDISVQPQGSFIQNNDFGSVSGSGTIQVVKQTAPMSAWYEYTYWSSPVQNETLDALTETNPNRRFTYNGENFLDATQESNNDNTTLPGQDDIDDNMDDWSFVPGSTIMQPGIGYAATLSEFAYSIAPGGTSKQITLSPFEGLFNNGIYTVPIYRNDFETNDNNWNLIGNPYPSAIDADLFFAANSGVDGAIYLWSQNTAPSAIANGNEDLNFSDSDYAIINGITEIAGGDLGTGNTDPSNRKIPSGQAFMISYSDAATPISTSVNGDGHSIAQGDVTFSNSMRTLQAATDNSEFYKISQSKQESNLDNKLWVNLTSDNGVFNQTAVAYVNTATDSDDGPFYDTQKPSGVVTGAILYSNIEGSSKKFGIQGKALDGLDIDEVISLGFKSNIGVATLFKLSIDDLEGDFLTGNTVYLKDNLLNKLHNLSASDYTFTTEVGEFNERFEIVFSASALSVDETVLNTNKFSIIDLDNNKVQFNTNSTLNIKTISVFDLLGRQLYDLKGQTNSEIYTLSNLNNAVYIAKIELSNGMIITKKAVKK